MKKRTNKKMRAIIYVVLGIIGVYGLALFILFMWFSGTFIPAYDATGTFLLGPWLIRKFLYVLSIAGIVFSAWIAEEGIKYLKRRKRH